MNEYFLNQSYPNPFNPSTRINYSIAEDTKVILKVYDVIGNEIATLISESKKAGNYYTDFRADKLSAGIYIVRMMIVSPIQRK